MTAITALGGPVIDLDGMRLPLLYDEADLGDLAVDTYRAVKRVSEWRSAGGPEGQSKRIYPGRYRRFRLEASYQARIEGWDTLDIQRYLGLQDEPEWLGKQGWPGRPRSRSVDRVVTQGDKDWAHLGAWPYATYGERRVPADWRSRRETVEALNEYISRTRQVQHASGGKVWRSRIGDRSRVGQH